MANVIEAATYDIGVYRYETLDWAAGGETGLMNKPIKNLANRTKWLKETYEALALDVGGHQSLLDALGTAAVKDASATKITNVVPLWQSLYTTSEVDALIAAASFRLAKGTKVVGDIGTGGGTDVVISIGSTLANANYMVFGSVVSKGDPGDDAVIWNVHSKTTSQFTIHFREMASVQNIDFDWEIKAK